MKYTVTKSVIRVVGRIWLPNALATYEYVLDGHQLGNLVAYHTEFFGRDPDAPIGRECVAHWLALNAGDFQSIIDFEASLEIDGETVSFDFEDDASELEFGGY
jgi:hypothetical protein